MRREAAVQDLRAFVQQEIRANPRLGRQPRTDRPHRTGRRIDRATPAASERLGCGELTMAGISHERSSGNVFANIGFTPVQGEDFAAKAR
jgi:hypothetical protein